jgi:hypothetical protein
MLRVSTPNDSPAVENALAARLPRPYDPLRISRSVGIHQELGNQGLDNMPYRLRPRCIGLRSSCRLSTRRSVLPRQDPAWRTSERTGSFNALVVLAVPFLLKHVLDANPRLRPAHQTIFFPSRGGPFSILQLVALKKRGSASRRIRLSAG